MNFIKGVLLDSQFDCLIDSEKLEELLKYPKLEYFLGHLIRLIAALCFGINFLGSTIPSSQYSIKLQNLAFRFFQICRK